MDNVGIENKLKQVFAQAFTVSEENITSETSMHSLEQWSSLLHFKLVAAVEQAFMVKFSEEEFMMAISFREILGLLELKIQSREDHKCSFP